MLTSRPGIGTEEQESVHLLTLESYPSLNLHDFNIEASEQLQMEAAQEPIEQASQVNKISATVSETNIIQGKRTRRAPK